MTKKLDGIQDCPLCKRRGERLLESTDFVLLCKTNTCPIHQWFPHTLSTGYFKYKPIKTSRGNGN